MKLPKLFKKKNPTPPRNIGMDPERAYTNPGFLKDLRERLVHRTRLGERIIVDLVQGTYIIGGKEGPYLKRIDRWTETPPEDLHRAGYLPGKRVPGYDSLCWWHVPIYVKLTNYEQFDIHVKDDAGRYIYSQDTPSTLHDEMVSSATLDFIKSMFKTALPKMDVQRIIMIAILGVGAVFGLMMMGVI